MIDLAQPLPELHVSSAGADTMKAYVAGEPFGIGALRAVTRAVPHPGPGQVLVRMRAASLNFRDLMVVRGEWRPAEPRVPGSDGVGEVVAVGAGTEWVRPGDRVAGLFLPHWTDGEIAPEKLRGSLGGTSADGVLAEYVVFDESAVVPVPAHLTDVEAATLPCAGVTAWNAVGRGGAVKAGDTVVVQGTGGVSLFALQLARALGATVIATTGSDGKRARLAEVGAAHTVNYRDTPWDERVLDLTGGRGADLVVETVGGENLNRALNAVRLGGAVSFVGMLGGTAGPVDTFGFVEKAVRLHGIHVGSREMFEELSHAVAAHDLRPRVDRVFSFGEVPEALQYLEAGYHFGKVCICF